MRRPNPFLAALLLLAATPCARAFPAPDVAFELGRTFGIESPTKGAFDQGGFSTTLSAMWPAGDLLRLGGAFYADDVGSETTELMDETQSPPVPLGTFQVAHLAIYGGSWRLEVVGPRLKRFETFARGDWGVYRHADREVAQGGLGPGRGNHDAGVQGAGGGAHVRDRPDLRGHHPGLHDRGARVALAPGITQGRRAPRALT
jgi:hypothetical protein